MSLPLKLLLSLCALIVFAVPASAAPAKLSGIVTYRERIALPADAQLHLQLIDQSLPGAPARIDARAAIGSAGQVPLNFALSFDDATIIAGHSYAIIAELSSGGRLWFRNFEPYVVDPVAPAAPVEVIVTFVGQITGAAPAADLSSEEPVATLPILNSVWHVQSLAGTPVIAHSDPTLTIGNDMRAGGRGGCNSWFAQAVVDETSIAFSTVAATLAACDDALTAQERAFFEALAKSRSYTLSGDSLTLLDATGSPVAILSR
jgi:putative lipoprotein